MDYVSTDRDRRGSALLIALLIAASLGLLGISFLMLSETESRIAENQRAATQALYAAQAGTRAVIRWFDRPGDTPAAPPHAATDRTLRLLDADGPGPLAPLPVASGAPLYKQGVDRDADGWEDLFDRPYRGSDLDALLGTAAGPDVRIDDARPGPARDYLEALSSTLFGAYPAAERGLRARIARIDIYSPPYHRVDGAWARHGVATVRVTARIYRSPDGWATEHVLAERRVEAVVNQIPYHLAPGPLASCADLTYRDTLSVHWGPVTVSGEARIPSDPGRVPPSLPRQPTAGTGIVWGAGFVAALPEFLRTIDGQALDPAPGGTSYGDPWLRLAAGEAVIGVRGGTSPWLAWAPGTPAPGPAVEHSNIDPYRPGVDCPELDYGTWKSLASAGAPDARYFVWDVADRFREHGSGPSIPFAQLTNDAEGVYFFDTRDRRAPRDIDGDGSFDNLTPPISVAGDWSFRGLLYLNSRGVQFVSSRGSATVLRAPGEPFEDLDLDGRFDPGSETWVNLRYPTTLGGALVVDAADDLRDDGAIGVGPMRNLRGPALTAPASMRGILYTSGAFEATGTARHYGTVIARSGVTQAATDAGTPEIYWDASIASDWPPAGWRVPRVFVTRWITDPAP